MATFRDFGEGNGPAWLVKREGDKLEVIAKDETVAQVDPKRLCEFLLGECKERGVVVHQPANVVSASRDMRDMLAGVRIAGMDGLETDSKSLSLRPTPRILDI